MLMTVIIISLPFELMRELTAHQHYLTLVSMEYVLGIGKMGECITGLMFSLSTE